MMKFQRQGCVLSNDYEELSITEIASLYILLGSCEFPSAMAGTYHVFP
jgi:hypothetical protein